MAEPAATPTPKPPWQKQEAARQYAYGAAFTAGKLKSHQMLIERALLLLHDARAGNLEARDKIQNIISYLQSSLSLRFEQARALFVVYGHAWDALETGTPEMFDRAEALLRDMRDLVMEVHRRQPKPLKRRRK
jgi:flagellin-specific chaperone FliS